MVKCVIRARNKQYGNLVAKATLYTVVVRI